MAKTEVILIKNVVNLGGESDLVKVSSGYARNYLLPLGYAVPLNQGNKRRLEVLKNRRLGREALEFSSMSELGKSLAKITLTLTVKTGDDGKMFGAVTNGTIADALKTQFDVSLDKKKIHLDHPIHALGEHVADLRLHAEVKVPLKVVVKSSNPLPEVPVVPAAEAARSEKRSNRNNLARKTEEAAPATAPTPEAKSAKPEGKTPKATTKAAKA